MTIAAIWIEDDNQWCAADTRLVVGDNDDTVSEIGSKIFTISVATAAIVPGVGTRAAHYSKEYGFVYAGSALPAVLTAAMANTLLSKLGNFGGRTDPPEFEQIANLVYRLAKRFMTERRRFKGDGKFSAAFFGFCPHANDFKVAHIEGREDAGGFRVEISFPPKPQIDGEPWLVLGSGSIAFRNALEQCKSSCKHASSKHPKQAIDKMVADSTHAAVGGSTSVGFAHSHGFELLYTLEIAEPGSAMTRRSFNGLDIDTEIGSVDPYVVAMFGMA